MSDIPVYVTTVKQKSVIDVNSKGSSAASVSAVVVSGLFAPGPSPSESEIETIEFVADRPFLYAIIEKATHTVLFMGTVTK